MAVGHLPQIRIILARWRIRPCSAGVGLALEARRASINPGRTAHGLDLAAPLFRIQPPFFRSERGFRGFARGRSVGCAADQGEQTFQGILTIALLGAKLRG